MKHRVVRLGQVVDINPSTKATDSADELVAFLAMADISEEGRVASVQQRPLAEVQKGYTAFQAGDVLLAKITPCFENGKAAFVEHLPTRVGFGSTEFHVLRPTKEIDPKFLFHLVWNANFRRLGASRMTGSAGQKRVPVAFLADYEFSLPPLHEQRHIATILDKVDGLRRKRQEAIRLADEFLRAAYLDLAERHPAAVPVETLLAGVPNAARTGPFGSQLLVSEFTESGIPVLGIDNVVSNAFTWAAPRFISAEKYAVLERYTVRPGDVMVTIMGTTGRVAIAPDDLPTCISTKHLCTLTLDQKKMLPTYLWACLRWDPEVKAQTRREAKGAIMEGWNMGIVKGLLVNAPPMHVQLKFEEIASRIKRMSSAQVLAAKGTDELMTSLSAKYLEPTA
ncbi:type I restriction enzyme S subunit [Pelomonas aquatica]|uniref:Type I restriction enzyme S subunit n=1 Tax=Pelomonas aquatica TaxID=431058 RepID=A0ABU1ZEG5_9BURK|nr:restriction endonuclease subunit S [Pelomonas aquatica]MDR7299021.1 type I restriction enzyme S subunit [Pelomonas aquatica]